MAGARDTIHRGYRDGFLGFVYTMDLLPEAFGIGRSKSCSHLLMPNVLFTMLLNRVPKVGLLFEQMSNNIARTEAWRCNVGNVDNVQC